MQFLTNTDFQGIIGENTLASLRGIDDININESEKLAITEMDPLRENFNIATELQKTGSERNDTLIRMLIHITAYYLYNTVDDADIPTRIDENYNNQLKNIEKIATGKLSSTIMRNFDESGVKIKSSYRFGSDPARHNYIF